MSRSGRVQSSRSVPGGLVGLVVIVGVKRQLSHEIILEKGLNSTLTISNITHTTHFYSSC